MHVVSTVGSLEEVDVNLGTGLNGLWEVQLRTVSQRKFKDTPVARGEHPGRGPHCLGASLALHGRLCSVYHSRDRDYDDIDDDDPFNPQARRIAAHNPPRGQLHSFCSYSSGLGSQTSLQPPAQTVSNAPVSEYMYGGGSRAPPPTALPKGDRSEGPESQAGRKASKTGSGRLAAAVDAREEGIQ